MSGGIFGRTLVLSACLAVAAAGLKWADGVEAAPRRQTFAEFPTRVGEWQGRPAEAFSPAVLSSLALDDHLNRFYTSPSGQLAHVYVGYYQSQRNGASIHSPLNCLPGAGWLPLSNDHLDIQVASAAGGGELRSITVNRYVIQKGLDRQLVLYWYQSHGRVVASEYWSKAYLVLDSMRIRRSDAALVRIIAPYRDTDAAPGATAEAAAVSLAKSIFPYFGGFLPS